MKIISYLDFISYKNEKIKIAYSEKNSKHKSLFLDLLFSNEFLEPVEDFNEFKELYIKYMDIDKYDDNSLLNNLNQKKNSIEEVVTVLKNILTNDDEKNKYVSFINECEIKKKTFLSKFSIENISTSEEKNIKDLLFGGKEYDSLKYNLSFNTYYDIFGSAGQSGTVPTNWNPTEFCSKLKEIDNYIKSIENFPNSEDEYKKIYNNISDIVPDYFKRTWYRKYLHILYPEYLPSQHTSENKRGILNKFNLDINKDDVINAAKILYLEKLSGISSDYFWYLSKKIYDKVSTNFIKESDNYYNIEDEQLNYNFIKCNSEVIGNKNIQDLYFGAPGTGKSYEVSQLIRKVYPEIDEKDNPFVFKTTIYSDYSYYDFVGNLVPKHNEDKLEYGYTPGIFTQALAQALNYTDKEIFLVIEEMSRGNVASIFGDIFQLLDRNEMGESEYSINNDLITSFLSKSREEGGIGVEIKKISLPRNLHVLGTVNTSDQNVNVIDTAFKRRFGFIYSDVSPVQDEDESILNSFKFTLKGKEFEWNRLYMSLNRFITEILELSEDKQIGQFFIKFQNYKDDKDRYKAIQNKLLHYLWEDVEGMIIDDNKSIFNKEKYSTFSKLYTGFKNEENIFSDKLITIYEQEKNYIG